MSKPEETEVEPAVAEPVAQDLMDVDVDDIAAEIERRASGEDSVPEPEADESVMEEEPEAIEAEPAESDDEAEEVAEDGEAEPDDEPLPVDDRLAALERRLEAADLERQQEAAKNEHLRFMLDRRSGEIGHLKNQLRQAEPVARNTDDDLLDVEPTTRQPVDDGLRQELEMARKDREERATERVAAAVRESFNEIHSGQSEFWEAVKKRGAEEEQEFQTKWNERFQKELSELDAAAAVSAADVKLASSIVKTAYKSAMAATRLEWLNRGTKGKSADQTARLKERKLAAAAGARGSRPRATPRPKPLSELSADEIKAEIDRRDALRP